MKRQLHLSSYSHKYFKLLLYVIVFLGIGTLNQAGNMIKTPEPWTAQAGSATFLLTNDTDTATGAYAATFAVNLRILNLSPQTFQIVLGFRKIDALFSPQGSTAPVTQITAPATGDSALSTTFNILVNIDDQQLLTELKANYLLIGNDLVLSLMVISYYIELKDPTYAICDALGGAQTCTYNVPVTIPALTYKNYLSISGFNLESKSTSIATPPPAQTATATKFQSKVKAFTLTNLQIEFKNDKVKSTAIKLFAITVHPTMFDQTVLKRTMFIELVQHWTSAAPFSQVFSETVIQTNYFVGFYAFKGFKWSFEIKESTPNDFFLGASITAGSNLLDFFGFVMYGYTSICFGYRYCLSCYLAPNFDCTQCQQNFILTAPFNTNSTCQCPAPLTIVSGVCDNHQFGCIIVVRLANNTLECQECDFNLKLILNPLTKMCECMPFFTMDTSFVCQETCGDGIRINAQCDDGNTISGDGCSSTCFLETGFDCDTTIQPTKCKSQTMLFYRIDRITKDPTSNKAVIKLYLPFQSTYPFPVLSSNFDPIMTYMNFRIILSMAPYTQMIIQDLQITDVGADNSILLSFSFNQTIEGKEGKIILDYENTQYFNYTQNLGFRLVGDNSALIYEAQIDSYKTISYGMLAGTAVNTVLLFVGFVSPKFIGLESILTLQLIFLSQTLVYDHMKFPVGFLFLQTLQYSCGFNQILELTQYETHTQDAKKMNYIRRKKTLIENFNINFIFLLAIFVVLVVIFTLRSKEQRDALQKKDQKQVQQNEDQEKLLPKKSKKNDSHGSKISLRKINDIIFYSANQMAFWLFLPLISAFGAEIIIENQNVSELNPDTIMEERIGQAISVISFFMIIMIIMSNFGNIWQSNQSMSNGYERMEKIYYKRWLFVYLSIVGFMILFMFNLYYMKIYSSFIVFLIQVIHMIVCLCINPYKKALKVHTIGLHMNNAIYLVFLIIINFINYMPQMQPNIAMFFGYAMLAFCVVSIIVTVIRLYYELRYGKELEQQLEEERIQRQKEEKLRKQAENKSKMEQMENDAKKKISNQQRIRQRNVYLHENQIKEDEKKELINWLENRPIDKKVKESYYFEKFAQKPLEWLRVHDPAKYQLKINELNQQMHNDQLRSGEKVQDDKYVALTAQLRKEVKTIKKMQQERVRMHEKSIKVDPNYSMNIHKVQQEKMVHQAYLLKD